MCSLVLKLFQVLLLLFQKLHFPLRDCPRFDELQNETQTSSEFQSRIQPYMVRLSKKKNKKKDFKTEHLVRC